MTQYSYIGIYFALFIGILGIPIPVEALLAFAGFLASQHKLNFFLLVFVAFLGTISGITPGYFMGKYLGDSVMEKYAAKLYINKEHLEKARQWNKKLGKAALLVICFIPGARHFAGLFSGISHQPFSEFALFGYAGSLLWVVTFTSLGYYFGDKWKIVLTYHKYITPMVAVIIIISIIYFTYRYFFKK